MTSVFGEFTPVQLPVSALVRRDFVWKLPRTHMVVPCLKLSGSYRHGEDACADRVALRMGIRRLSLLMNSGVGMMIDATEVKLAAQDPHLRIEQALLRKKAEPLCLICQGESEQLSVAAVPPVAVRASLSSAANFMALALKAFRFDGGKSFTGLPPSFVPQLQPVEFVESGLQFHGVLGELAQAAGVIGVVSFSGHYRRGSEGREDAVFVKVKMEEFCERFRPLGLVCDLRDMDYEWGDDLDPYPEVACGDVPIKIVVAGQRFEAYAGILDRGDLCVSLEDAIEEVASAARRRETVFLG